MNVVKENRVVPLLRFKQFNEDWECKLLDEVSKITTGSTPPTSKKEYYGGNRLFVSPADIGDNRYVTSTKTTLTELGFNEGRQLNKGSVLFVCIGSTIGKTAQINEVSVSNQQINALTANSDNSNDFIFSLLSCNAKKIKRFAGVQAVPQINKTDFSKFKFYFPSLLEQQKIASFLSAVDEKIQQLTKKKELLEDYKKGIMQKIFSQEIRFKDDNGNKYPDWEDKKLGELTHKVGKKNKENISYPIYSINNQEGFLLQSEQFEGLDSNARGYDISIYKIVNEKTFAYNPARINVGSIGYSYNLNEIIISSLYVCFKTNKELEDLYLLAYVDSYIFNKNILRYQEGGVRQYLFYENFSQIKIPLPSNDEQKKVADFLSSIDKKIELVNNQLERTKEFKKGLLQQMFV